MQVFPLNGESGKQSITSGTYTLPEISGNVTICVDNGDKVILQGTVKGKGTLTITGASLDIEKYEGDIEIIINKCWIVSPFINETSSLLIRNSTILCVPCEQSIVTNRGLKLVIENTSLILAGYCSSSLNILNNCGELFTCFRLSIYIHCGHDPIKQALTFLKSQKGQVELVESFLLKTSHFVEKPILVSGENSLIRLVKFNISSQQEFISTRVKESKIYFDHCFINNKVLRELDERQEIIGNYNTHMSGEVFVVHAKQVYVNTEKAPINLQLPLEARHNELVLIQKLFARGFPVKIQTCKGDKEFVLGQGSQRPCYVILRYSSQGWMEKEKGNGEGSLKPKKTQEKSKTIERKSKSKSIDRSKPSLSSSKQIREKYRKSRETRKKLSEKSNTK